MLVIPVWFDSMGAKSACVYIETKDVKILIDPGSAALQPGFPLPDEVKAHYDALAMKAIESFGEKANIIIITHYHYDHHTLPGTGFDARKVYLGKTLLVKDPNQYINGSQHERARLFFSRLLELIGEDFSKHLSEPETSDFEDPLEWIPKAAKVDFGDYNKRRRELLEKGKEWFKRVSSMWASKPWVKEYKGKNLTYLFADGKEFSFGGTRIKFTKPMFHGIEYERLGWVIGVVIEAEGKKVLYSSDIQGPFIEDYADWIISENPDIIFLDGPPTYQLGYMMNVTNFKRALENAKRIIRETEAELIIYDHHLLRDIRWRERVKSVLEEAQRLNKKVLTAAEYYDRKPIADVARLLKEGRLDEVNPQELMLPEELLKALMVA